MTPLDRLKRALAAREGEFCKVTHADLAWLIGQQEAANVTVTPLSADELADLVATTCPDCADNPGALDGGLPCQTCQGTGRIQP